MRRFLSLFVLSIILLTSFILPTDQVRANTCVQAYCYETLEQISVDTNTSTNFNIALSPSSANLNDAIVDFEIYNTNGVRVFQKVFEHQYISNSSSKTYQFSWKPSTAGTYTLRSGIFKSNWSGLLDWNDKVSEITVSNTVVAPVPSPVVESTSTPAPAPAPVQTSSASLNVWWPANNIALTGVQPFKFAMSGLDVNSYDAFWQVDSGQLNRMQTNWTDGAHKESLVNVGAWNWKGVGPYVLTFSAKDKNGKTIAQKKVTIYIGSLPGGAVQNSDVVEPQPTESTQIVSPALQPVSSPSVSGLYVNPNSPALAQAEQWKNSNPTNAALMKKIGDQPSARWFGGWNSNIYSDVKNYVDTAASVNAMPVLVAYNIPQRDCGGYSGGGSNSPDSYKTWISDMAKGIGSRKALVILEPDAIALNNCLSATDKQTRFDLISFAVNTLKANPNAKVYIDAGHDNWIGTADMADRLSKAGVAAADGFSLNVSNFSSTAGNTSYGSEISKLINNKHFVIDTSRNGNGSNGEWCNPSGRALGEKPTLNTGNSLVDGYLWIKTPGESDGNCNGGPSAGQWWSDYALGLAKNAAW